VCHFLPRGGGVAGKKKSEKEKNFTKSTGLKSKKKMSRECWPAVISWSGATQGRTEYQVKDPLYGERNYQMKEKLKSRSRRGLSDSILERLYKKRSKDRISG